MNMEKFLFTDGCDVCLYSDGEVTRRGSKFIEKYKNAAQSVERASNWKYEGEGAMFRGDYRRRPVTDEDFASALGGVFFGADESEAVYSFTVGATSGIYKINLNDEKAEETHVINSVEYKFAGGCCASGQALLATSISRGDYCSDIAVFDLKSSDYRTVTEGDTLDCDPFISPDDANDIYFSSRGVGRGSQGEFVAYSPAAICKLNLSELDIKEVASSNKYSYFKPVLFGGKLYVLRTPAKEKSPNPLIEIILIPFRILQAIVNFINAFVRMFTGKSLASGGNNPTKEREYDSRKDFIRGNLINVEKERKKNAKKDKSDYGFIPQSWQIVEVGSGEVIKGGVADYDILADGTFIVTNGRRIFAIKDGKTKKLCNAERCLCVAAMHSTKKECDLFGYSIF